MHFVELKKKIEHDGWTFYLDTYKIHCLKNKYIIKQKSETTKRDNHAGL